MIQLCGQQTISGPFAATPIIVAGKPHVAEAAEFLDLGYYHVSLFLNCGCVAFSPAAAGLSQPFWEIGVDFDGEESVIVLDAIPGSTLSIPASRIRLQPQLFATSVAPNSVAFQYMWRMAPSHAPKSSNASFTDLRNLALGIGASSAIRPLPASGGACVSRRLVLHSVGAGLLANIQVRFFSYDATTTVATELASTREIWVPGTAGFYQIINATGVAIGVSSQFILGL